MYQQGIEWQERCIENESHDSHPSRAWGQAGAVVFVVAVAMVGVRGPSDDENDHQVKGTGKLGDTGNENITGGTLKTHATGETDQCGHGAIGHPEPIGNDRDEGSTFLGMVVVMIVMVVVMVMVVMMMMMMMMISPGRIQMTDQFTTNTSHKDGGDTDTTDAQTPPGAKGQGIAIVQGGVVLMRPAPGCDTDAITPQ